MTTLPSMGLTLPTRGPSGSGHWADVLDANLALLDSHSHGPGSGARITPLAINIDRDLTFNTSWAITALNRATFAAVAPPAVNKSIFVGDGTSGTTANELYWTNNVGTNVKLTSGNTLNVASFVGGIVDDYASVGAQLGYDNGAKRYTFKQGTADSFKWAKLQAGSLRLVEYNTTETVFVEQLCPAALAVTYAMTWPLALPAASNLVAIDNTGQIAFSNTISQAVTFGAGLTVSAGGAAITGNSTITGNLNVTGTLTNGETKTWSVALGIAGPGATVTVGGSPPNIGIGTATTGTMLPLDFKVGVTITAWEVRLIKNTDNTKTLSAKLWKGAAPTQIGATQSNTANAPGIITLGQSSLTEVVTTQTGYFIEIVGSGTSGDFVTGYYQATTA